MRIEDYRCLSVSVRDRVATVTLQRPELRNAVGRDAHRELATIFRTLAREPACDVVILTGAGEAFCAGGDLGWMQAMIDDPRSALPLIEETKAIVLSMLDLPKPMLCRMNGDAIGLGATLALGCDIIVAVEGARFGDPHVRMGLAAGDGAALLLPEMIGHMRAKELLLTGDMLSVEEGHALGLINHVVARDALDARVETIAARLANGAGEAIGYTKAALNAGLRKRACEQMDMLIAYEVLSMRSPDHAEAVAAMRERRKPVFIGRTSST